MKKTEDNIEEAHVSFDVGTKIVGVNHQGRRPYTVTLTPKELEILLRKPEYGFRVARVMG